jgi:hypothetical protein
MNAKAIPVALAAVVIIISGYVAWPQLKQTGGPTISLQIDSSTWREGAKPYDVGKDISQNLQNAGFNVQRDAGTPSSYIMTVQCKDEKGRQFGSNTANMTASSVITCSVRVESNDGTLVATERCRAALDADALSIKGSLSISQALFEMVVGHLQTDLKFKYLGDYLLLRLGKTDELTILAKALKDEDTRWSRIHTQAVARLEELGQPATTLLLSSLYDKDTNVRFRAVEALARVGDESLIPKLNSMYDEAFYPAQNLIEKLRGKKAGAIKKL